MENNNQDFNSSRRGFIKKMAFVPPAIVTLSAIPAIASAGSPKFKVKGNNGVGNGKDTLPPGIQQNAKLELDNDDNGGTPGKPQSKGGTKK